MTYPKANRPRHYLTIAAITAIAAFMPAAANADVTVGVSAVFESNVPAAHGDFTVTHTYGSYDGVPSLAGNKSGDDLKQWVLDSPAGLVGNPNAIPYVERCTQAQWSLYVENAATPAPGTACPASSIVGDAALTVGVDGSGLTAPGMPLLGTIYLVQSVSPFQEVPALLGTIIESGPSVASKSAGLIAPVTSGDEGDYRLRMVSETPLNAPILDATPAYGHVKGIVQHLNGVLPNGNAFLTNPPRCGDWNTYLYAQTRGTDYQTGNTIAPNVASQTTTLSGTVVANGGTVSGLYAKATATPTFGSCATPPPFVATRTETLSTNTRDSNPQVDVVFSNPGAPGSDLPKSIVASLPASVTIDLQNSALLNICSAADAATGACAAASKVGTLKVETPLIAAGLTGNVFAVRGATVLPDLLLDAPAASNAFGMRVKGSSSFTGRRGNEIQVTFDNLPQLPITKFSVTVLGGKDSILTISKCPAVKAPEDGRIKSLMTGYSGAVVYESTATNFFGCYSRPAVSKIKKCVKSRLVVKPRNLLHAANITKVELYIGKKKRRRVAKDAKSPYTFSVKLAKKKHKRGIYKFQVRSTYKPTVDAPKGMVMKSKISTFKKC